MLTLPSRLQAFISPRAPFAPAAPARHQDLEMDAIDQISAHTQESVQLLRQISIKAPQLAAVLDQLEQGGSTQRIEFTAAPAAPRLARSGSMLDITAGLLSNAFPTAAPLFYSCRTYLHLKLLKKKTG
ncbi:hypothetical protein [Herbaspirillum sp. YR522]|uniref:hypothetical protein n=1 Tax=Herbaspirillum sp. YR522 TaxID=1144342 RepID=UPI00026F8847|nr:hypothetical protein [Herbaspirillum sp. YR522]EJN06942.1 hypothetical protein PMI40_02127 [Herbaspirillum sp. YR522]